MECLAVRPRVITNVLAEQALEHNRILECACVTQAHLDARHGSGCQGSRWQAAGECCPLEADAAPSRSLGHRGQQLHLPLRLLRRHELAPHLL